MTGINIDQMADRYIKAGLVELQKEFMETLDFMGFQVIGGYYSSYSPSRYQRHDQRGEGGFMDSYKTGYHHNRTNQYRYGDYWVDFSPEYMSDIYYEYTQKKGVEHGAPVSKESVFSWNFDHGRHGFNRRTHSWIFGELGGETYIPVVRANELFEDNKKQFNNMAADILDEKCEAFVNAVVDEYIKEAERHNNKKALKTLKKTNNTLTKAVRKKRR